METWWDGKEVNNELQLQLHCICTNDNVKPTEPSSVLLLYAVYGQHILSPYQPFPSFQRYVSVTRWQHSDVNPESHVCVCVCVCVCWKPQCLYDTFFDLLNLFRPFWEMFRERHDNTAIHASDMGNYMLHARGLETLQTFTFRLLWGKQLQRHSEQTVTFQFRYMSLLSY
jgi:hypothetical protein